MEKSYLKLFFSFFLLTTYSCSSFIPHEEKVSRSPSGELDILNCVKLLSRNIRESRIKYRVHPDLIWKLSKLEKGQEIYLTRGAFDHIPMIRDRVEEIEKVRVVKIANNNSMSGNDWKADHKTIFVESESIGRVGIPSMEMLGNVYRRGDFMTRSPFSPGEYIQVGTDWDSQNVFKMLDSDGQFNFEGSAAPYIGVFKRVYDQNHYIVEVQAKMQSVEPIEILVPKNKILGLHTGTEEIANESLDIYKSIQLSFSNGETIRYRNTEGLMELGVIKSKNGNYYSIESENQLIEVHSDEVFKQTGIFRPSTPNFKAEGIFTSGENPSGVYRDFLNRAAKIVSTKEFSQMGGREKIDVIRKYVDENVPWTKAATMVENAGLDNFSDIICAGAGVCRHNSVLLASILSETGFTTRLVSLINRESLSGHIWLEVDMKLIDGTVETFVVDPSSSGTMIEPIWKVYKMASENKESTAAEFYAHPKREYIFPEN